MDLLTINQSKCKKDGVCVASCPMAIIKLQDGDGYPEIIQWEIRSAFPAALAWLSVPTVH